VQLLTLGQLSLSEGDFSRSKPLLLLVYLSVVGGALERRHVAELFWSGKSDYLNSLSSALNQLRQFVPSSVEADEQRVWTEFNCDSHVLLEAFNAKDYVRVVELYGGPFLETVNASRLGEELEAWVLETREFLAARVQEAMLRLGEFKAAKALFTEAAELAERAFRLPGALEPEPEVLGRYFVLLQAGGSAFADVVKSEAEAFGVVLGVTAEDAKARLQTQLIGRELELARLKSLELGSWLWLSGASGMGKTALLKALAGVELAESGVLATYVQARKGLPYITLEPFIKDVLSEGEEAMLRKLLGIQGFWLTDAWELMDAESQALLRRLRDLRPDLTVVIASQAKPVLPADDTLQLKPLTKEALAAFEGAFESTGGVPALLAAFLRGDSLDAVLRTKLSRLSDDARQLYLCLALMQSPDLVVLRKALGLDAAAFVAALESLLMSGLIDADYSIQARQAAAQFLEANPVESAQLALRLARQLKGLDAFLLYEASESFWSQDDLLSVREAYLAWAEALLKRGFPQRAVEVLNDCPEANEAVKLLKARALHRTGLNREALELLAVCKESAELLALSAMANWRLGEVALAESQATLALQGDTFSKASAENVLSQIRLAQGEFEAAKKHAKKAAMFWQVLGEKGLFAFALNNEANASYKLGEAAEAAYEKALAAAADNPMVQSVILNNLAVHYSNEGQYALAEDVIAKAIALALEVGSLTSAAESWNNLGAFRFEQGKKDEALDAYAEALELARKAEDLSLVGVLMANQAEITGDVDGLEMAIELLNASGHTAEAKMVVGLLPEGHALRD